MKPNEPKGNYGSPQAAVPATRTMLGRRGTLRLLTTEEAVALLGGGLLARPSSSPTASPKPPRPESDQPTTEPAE